MRSAPIRMILFSAAIALACSALASTTADIVDTRTATIGAGDIAAVSIDAGAGRLEIQGSREASSVTVVAEFDIDAPAQRVQQVLQAMTFTTEVRGTTLYVEAGTDGDFHEDDQGRIHLTVTVPDRLTLDIDDGSGPIRIRSVAGDLSIRDGSADIEVTDAGGNVTITDGSGDITLHGVAGWAEITDGSGSLDLEAIGMAVKVTDSSGDIDIRDVGGDVVVSDSSGGIDVRGIEGDFEVLRDSSGSIRHRDVHGTVKIPPKT